MSKCEEWRTKRKNEKEMEEFNALPLEDREEVLETLLSELEARAKQLLKEVKKKNE